MSHPVMSPTNLFLNLSSIGTVRYRCTFRYFAPLSSPESISSMRVICANMPKIILAIIGGGVAGLALAAGLLKKPHLLVHVYEAVDKYSDVGAGLVLHRNAIRALTPLGPEVR